MKLETGICGEQSVSVTQQNTAKTMGSGTLDVFATPALVALAEKTCWMSVAPALEEGSGTVGTNNNTVGNNNGTVDIGDLILILNHYTK